MRKCEVIFAQALSQEEDKNPPQSPFIKGGRGLNISLILPWIKRHKEY